MQKINVDLTVTDGATAEAVVKLINQLVDSFGTGTGTGYQLGYAEGSPEVKVPGEIYVPATGGYVSLLSASVPGTDDTTSETVAPTTNFIVE